MANENVLAGCDFDSLTASATHGSKVLAFVASKTSEKLYAVAGQTGLSFNLNVETSSTSTKDQDGGWAVNFPGTKSFDASVDALYVFDDEGRKAIMTAVKEGAPVCLGIYKMATEGNKTKYTCIRKGLCIMTSDSLDAPNEDNMTGSMSFTGTGKCYMIETATEEERKLYDFEDDGAVALAADALG